MWTKRGKARLILIFSTNTNCESMAYRSFRSEKCSARGVRKVTTGIIGLWQPNVHSDISFWAFEVGSSYPLAGFCFSIRMQTAKAWPIDPFGLGNVQLEVAAKVTTGISGLKQPNVHRDVVFWSFEVGSSYPSGARLILLFNTNANCEGMLLFKLLDSDHSGETPLHL